jgi:diamine N-acetyltransferase
MEPTFRTAVDSDTEAILGFMRSLYEQDGVAYDEPVARRTLAAIMGDRALGRVWMICEGSEPIGYMVLTLGYSLEYGGRDAFIDELFVHESRRRRGIGRKALQFFIDACRDLDVRALHLQVHRPNRAAQELYRKFGFVDNDLFLMTRQLRD